MNKVRKYKARLIGPLNEYRIFKRAMSDLYYAATDLKNVWDGCYPECDPCSYLVNFDTNEIEVADIDKALKDLIEISEWLNDRWNYIKQRLR